MVDIVNAVFVGDGRVLLARRSPHRRNYPNVWSFPGGHVEKGETLVEALARELEEEVAVVPTAYKLVGTISDPNTAAAAPITYHLYAVTAWLGGEPHIVDAEHTELRWFSLVEAAELKDLALGEYRTLFADLATGDPPKMT